MPKAFRNVLELAIEACLARKTVPNEVPRKGRVPARPGRNKRKYHS